MEKTIVYIAGCPDAYPVEYYDVQSGSYRGVIPQLLQQFSQQSDYEVRYYEPGQRDRRQHLARNRQVDMVTCLDGECAYSREVTLRLLEKKVNFFGPAGCSPNATCVPLPT